jgi:hypothetical protein
MAIAALSAAALLGAGCSKDGSTAAVDTGNGLTISFRTLADAAQGDNKVEAIVKQNGLPVTDATVAVTFRMPAMPTMNMPEMHSTVPLIHESDGHYGGTGQLEMTGTWNVSVTVARGGTQVGNSRFTVVAK